MKKLTLLTILGIFIAGATFAQSEETRSLSGFTSIFVQEGIDVHLKKGNREEARIVSDSHDLDEVLTDVSSGRLKIHLEGNNHGNVNVDVYVTYTSLNALAASSAGSIDAEGVIDANNKDFDVDASSAGQINVEIENILELDAEASSAGDIKLKVDAESIDANVSSAGDVEISGRAKKQDIQVSSSGDYDGYEIVSEEVEVDASSGGSAKVTASSKIDASASSGASVRYRGEPKNVYVNSSSGGSVRKS